MKRNSKARADLLTVEEKRKCGMTWLVWDSVADALELELVSIWEGQSYGKHCISSRNAASCVITCFDCKIIPQSAFHPNVRLVIYANEGVLLVLHPLLFLLSSSSSSSSPLLLFSSLHRFSAIPKLSRTLFFVTSSPPQTRSCIIFTAHQLQQHPPHPHRPLLARTPASPISFSFLLIRSPLRSSVSTTNRLPSRLLTLTPLQLNPPSSRPLTVPLLSAPPHAPPLSLAGFPPKLGRGTMPHLWRARSPPMPITCEGKVMRPHWRAKCISSASNCMDTRNV